MDYVNRQYMGTYNPRTSHEPNIIYQPILIPIISPYIWLRFFHTIPSKHHKNIYWNHSHKTSMWTCVYVQVWLPHPEPKICSIPQMHWFQCRKMLRNKNWLVVYLPLWKIWVRQWEGWHPIYEMENKSHVWNHQPEKDSCKGRILRKSSQCRSLPFQCSTRHCHVVACRDDTPSSTSRLLNMLRAARCHKHLKHT